MAKKQPKPAKVDAVLAKAQAEAHAEAQRQRDLQTKVYVKKLDGMSHNQLRGELRRSAKDMPGLGAIEALVSLVVFEGTKTLQNPFAKLHAYPR